PDRVVLPSVTNKPGKDPRTITFHPVPVVKGRLNFLNTDIDNGKATYELLRDTINNFALPKFHVRTPMTLLRKLIEQNIISKARARLSLQPIQRSDAHLLDSLISTLVHNSLRFKYPPSPDILNLPIPFNGLGFSSIEPARHEQRSVTAAITGPATAVFSISGRAASILHGEVFAQIAAFTVAHRDRDSRLYSDHLLTTTLLERYTSRPDFEHRIRRMNARSYYRWLFALAEQHRDEGLHSQYTPGHSAAVDLPAALNGFADHYATHAQRHRDDLPAAPTPSFAMDDYTFWTAQDGWVEASMRDFYSHHRARQQGRSLASGRGGRMAAILYAGPRPEYPYTRAYASYSAAVQLYARSGQLPTARTLSQRNRSIVCMSPMCRHGCVAVEDDYHVFVACPRYAVFRLESAAELARRIRRRVLPALTDAQSAGIIAASETFYNDGDLWPTTHAMYFLGLTPKLAGLIPRAAFTSNTSYRMCVSACEVDWHYAAIRLAGRIWGDFQSEAAKRHGGL
ncbi:hypothetical protein EXIGLDRAFT_620489, partial [Exidia glandulosa HHB12029]